MSDGECLVPEVRARCRPAGPDAVIEVCGVPEAMALRVEMLPPGGAYVPGGIVNPQSIVTIDASWPLSKMLTLRGVHDYHPRNLVEALDVVVASPIAAVFLSRIWWTPSIRSIELLTPCATLRRGQRCTPPSCSDRRPEKRRANARPVVAAIEPVGTGVQCQSRRRR